MSTRVLGLTEQFHRAMRRMAPAGSTGAQAVAATLARLVASQLPTLLDSETLVPPVRRLWFRRVPGCNLWVLYSFDVHTITIRSVVNVPPVPID